MEQGLLLSDWNSLENQMVLVNAKGKIFMVNEAWRYNDLQHGMISPHYLETSVDGDWSLYQNMTVNEAARTRAGIAAVLAGQIPHFTLNYPDYTTSHLGWFAITVTPVNQSKHGLVISRQLIKEEVQKDVLVAKQTQPATRSLNQQPNRPKVVPASLTVKLQR